MPDIVFMDMDGNEIRKDITDINSLDDVKKSFKELDKKRKLLQRLLRRWVIKVDTKQTTK